MDRYQVIDKLSSVTDKFLPFLNKYKSVEKGIKVLHCQTSKPFQAVPTDYLSLPISKSFQEYGQINQTEYLYRFSGIGKIEPLYGWIILPSGEYLASSLPYQVYPKPSPLKLRLGIKRTVKLDSVISIRYGFGNYWHFYNDILGQLFFINKFNLNPQIPVLAPKKLLKFKYVREFFERTNLLNQREWIFQNDNELVECKEIYLAKNTPNIKENFQSILSCLGIKNNDGLNQNRIFLKRGISRGRRLGNIEEIEGLAKEFDYNIIDTENASLEEQIQIFSNARYVLGIHGAGLANLIFRDTGSLHLTEIFPANNIPPHYFWLCHEFGFTYDAVLGGLQNRSGAFSLPVKSLEQKLAALH